MVNYYCSRVQGFIKVSAFDFIPGKRIVHCVLIERIVSSIFLKEG